ncbi:hypothetical protein ABGB17_22480 [Sphaerisporangium sp. B11E5]|uniref:hypothetical protein n=1 Tax=Sphaerisporangium sp. B11E5 TaxID=3153563 RepID=UPI00325E805E
MRRTTPAPASTCSADSGPSPPKYTHHRHAASASPSVAATSSAGLTAPCAPMPIATTDSPSATMTSSPCRSTMCAGCSGNPFCPMKYGLTHTSTTAAPHSRCASAPSVNPAANSSPVAPRLNGTTRTNDAEACR